MRPEPPDDASSSSTKSMVDLAGSPEAADCRTCELRQRCISYGWRSPGGLWFENAVVLRPKPGCRGFIGRSGDIRGHFVRKPSEDLL